MKLPSRLDPCPIIEALVEIRFETNFPHDAVFGLLYNSIKDKYSVVSKLPVADIPEQIRNSDMSLQFSPHYKLQSDKYICQVGPKVLTVNCLEPYSGWDEYFEEIKYIISKFKMTGVPSKVTRLGVRYINFFMANIFEHINIKIVFEGARIGEGESILKFDFHSGEFISTLHVASGVRRIKQHITLVGSIVDIDTHAEFPEMVFDEQLFSLIDSGHQIGKDLFFRLVTDELVGLYNPVYGGE